MGTDEISIFLVVFVFSIFFVRKWNEEKQQKHRYPPSLPSLPIVGSLPFLRGFDHIPKFFTEKSRELGPIFTFRVGSRLVLILNDKKSIEEALVHNSRSFSSRPECFMQKLINPNRKGIEFKDTTPEWRRIHKNSLSVLREFGFGDKSIMEERIMKEIEEMVDFGRKTGGKPFDPKELFLLVTSNVTTNIIFGLRHNYDLGISELVYEAARYTHLMDMIFDIAPFLRFIPPFKRKIPEMISSNANMRNIVEREIEKSLQSNKRCFVSEFIRREGQDYDREELYFILRDLVIVGTDTTATTVKWAMVVFVNHPEIQKKLQEDIDSVIPRDRFPTLQDQQKLPYVEATINELYRWRTLVPLSIAHYNKHDAILKDYFIPAGTLVFPNLYGAHNDQEVWKDPDVFRPERFLDKEHNLVGLDRVIPFSLGRRSCLGENLARTETFLILTSFLQRFTVLPPEGQDKVCDQPTKPVEIMQFPGSFSIRLLERDNEEQRSNMPTCLQIHSSIANTLNNG